VKKFGKLLVASFVFCLVAISGWAQPSLNYDIDLVVDYDAGSFEGTVEVAYTNLTGIALSELFFRLYANDDSLYGTAFVQILDIAIQTDSRPFSLYLNDTVVLVPLDEPLQPDEPIEVTIAFSGGASNWPANQQFGSDETGYGLLTKSASALTLTTFYPMLAVYSDEGWALDPSTGFGDTLMGDTADYLVRLAVRGGPMPITSGELVAVNPEIDSTTYDFKASNARDFSLVLVEQNYTPLTTTLEEASIRTWFTAQSELAGQLAIDLAVFSFELFEDLVGPCPFREIDLVEVPLRSAAGVEFSGLILVGSQYTQDPRDLFFSIIISHEMAHQWFYAGVGNDVSEHPWLDESFATYLSYEFLDMYYNTTTAQGQLATWRVAYQRAQRNWESFSISSPRYAFPNSSIYSSFVYSGGALFLYDLRQELGDEAFYRALQTYYSSMLYAMASPDDFIRIIEESCACQIDELLSIYRIMP
jgi:Peptidase family M1 domain